MRGKMRTAGSLPLLSDGAELDVRRKYVPSPAPTTATP
jgi:hypothetical protein